MGSAGGQNRIEYARVDWDAQAPRSMSFSDVYWSPGGPAEKRHVFIDGAGLPARFPSCVRFAIAEIGFGAGLSFLETWKLWREIAKPGARLSYHAIEGFPLAPADLARAHASWPAHATRAAALRAHYPPPLAGPHILRLDHDIDLTLHFGEAGDVLAGLEGGFDAWFFDGFAPSKNPAMWRKELFDEAARLSRPGATFATYAVAGAVRRALGAAGFSFEKRKGFGAKKEMLAGQAPASAPRTERRAPWHARGASGLTAGSRVAVIGGGIAGASIAFAARRAGLAATIIEAGRLGAGASGNPCALVMPRIDLGGGPAPRFFLSAYVHAIRMLSEIAPEAMVGRGALLAAADEGERARQARIVADRLLPEGWIEPRAEGLFFPQAAAVEPLALLGALAAETEILVCRARAIGDTDDGVSIAFDDGSARRFDAVVLANGVEALKFRQAAGLPLARVAGQIDWYKSAPAPPCILASGAYAAPAPHGGLVLGATYGAFDAAAAARANLAAIREVFPEIADGLSPAQSTPRRASRCQTPDRLPVAGPLPDLAFYGAEYDDLRLGRKRDFPPGRSLPRVFALTGLGSRGFATAPFAAVHVVAEMTDAPSPLERAAAEVLHPARFFIRDLKRAQRPQSP